ncbi:MAG: hypothetical protein KAI47_14045 [Deltaproteobacteria bacterium]|nr:hypothetical protein [Deltaproteobacteria bacterium]
MRRHLSLYIVLPGLFVLNACSDPTRYPVVQPNPVTEQDLQAFCTAFCEREAKCGQAQTSCNADCLSTHRFALGRFQANYFHELTQCKNAADCTKSDDTCALESMESFHPNYQGDALFTTCMKEQQTCPNGMRFSDDYCFDLVALMPSSRKEMEACYSSACDVIRTCIRTALGLPPQS